MMGHVRVGSEFFNVHLKRFAVSQGEISELLPFAKHKHLIDVFRTPWGAKIDGLAVFIVTYVASVDALESIKGNSDGT